MLTKITGVDLNWVNVKNKCRIVAGMEPCPGKPSDQFKWQILLAEVPQIRLLTIHWRWTEICSWVANHWSRHKWECFISPIGSHSDNKPRGVMPQDDYVSFDGVANAQHLIDTMRIRLCGNASTYTRIYAYDLKAAILKRELMLGAVLVPECIYRCGCPNAWCCGLFQRVLDAKKPDVLDIEARYQAYNEYFLGE